MSTAAGGLKDLHQLHIQLRDVQDQLARGPRLIKARRQFGERKQDEFEAQKAHVTELRKSADQKALQLKTNEAKIAELSGKLNTASSNREFDIIKSQIDADTMANSVLEDEILEAMEKIDAALSVVKELEKELDATRSELQRFSDDVAAVAPQLEEDAQRLETALQSAERTLPGEVAVVYRRLVQAHGSAALARVENGACAECHATLAPQERVQVNVQRIIFCRSCGRILYRADVDATVE